MMPFATRWLRHAGTCAVACIVLVLALAFLWTVLQIASVHDLGRSLDGTTAARRDAYRATATAINVEHERVSLRAGSSIVLLQLDLDSPMPAKPVAVPTASPTVPAQTPAPEDISLPKLLLPRDPPAGKWLSGTQAPSRAPEAFRAHRLVNVLLLGSDEQVSDDNFIRTDTMIVVSLNVETGTLSMLSFPRDLFVYIPHGRMGRLNTAFGLGENLNWDPGGGFGLLRQTIFYNFGINVHYYARVDFSGFEAIIDRLGGVDIAVDCVYRDYYPVGTDDVRRSGSSGYRLRTLPVGYYTFDGFDALWYARTRKYTDDFDRGRRHQLLIRAIWRKARSQGLATTLPQLWPELTKIVDTDLPFEQMLRLLPLVINLDLDDVQNYTFRKIYHTRNWTTPDGWIVLLPNREAVAKLMQALYTPPSRHQTALAGPRIAVYNASGEANWDVVASERLRWGGYNAIALGRLDASEDYPINQLIDHVAAEKGSLVPGILQALNMTEEQVNLEVRADRAFDYVVIIGRDYESCTFGVLPLDG
ncbi:MAG: LCP family protein [Chloroflexi bacterium]|nr:LCP family protein [Chloroflexota bacterium]